jgi:hypothetical protein
LHKNNNYKTDIFMRFAYINLPCLFFFLNLFFITENLKKKKRKGKKKTTENNLVIPNLEATFFWMHAKFQEKFEKCTFKYKIL